jgi:hypothetical protein
VNQFLRRGNKGFFNNDMPHVGCSSCSPTRILSTSLATGKMSKRQPWEAAHILFFSQQYKAGQCGKLGLVELMRGPDEAGCTYMTHDKVK